MLKIPLYCHRLSDICLILLFIGCYGCKTAPEEPSTFQVQALQTFDGTLASLCELTGYADAAVEGYGVVCGLRGTGSSECPETLKGYILNALRSEKVREEMGLYYSRLSAEEVLLDRSTAVVQVNGIVPAGSPRGQLFDVNVVALPGTQTRSLVGGVLLPCDLKTVAQVSGRPLASGIVARAGGPVFVNPFPLSQPGNPKVFADPRKARIIGGGLSLRDRQLALSLLEPSWRRAEQVQNRINGRFSKPDGPQVAVGQSRQVIQIKIPDEYADRYNHFISLILTLYVEDNPAYIEQKTGELSRLVLEAQSDLEFEDIALAWEAIGIDCLPYLSAYLGTTKGRIAYYASRTALALGEMSALDNLLAIAQDAEHPCREQVIDDLAYYGTKPKVRAVLLAFLDGNNAALRVRAYDALSKSKDPRIRSFYLKRGFWIDTIETTGPEMLCVYLGETPRFLLFGPEVPLSRHVFFEDTRIGVTINASAEQETVTAIRRLPRSEQRVMVDSRPELGELIVKLALPLETGDEKVTRGAGLSYDEIAGLLHGLADDEAGFIQAGFHLHRESQN